MVTFPDNTHAYALTLITAKLKNSKLKTGNIQIENTSLVSSHKQTYIIKSSFQLNKTQ